MIHPELVASVRQGERYLAEIALYEIMETIEPKEVFRFKFSVKRQAFELNIDALKPAGVSTLKEQILSGIITTDDFEITFSEYEGTILKANDEQTARLFFQAITGLFPFVEPDKDMKRVKVECEFEIKKDELYGKDDKKRGKLSCTITVND